MHSCIQATFVGKPLHQEPSPASSSSSRMPMGTDHLDEEVIFYRKELLDSVPILLACREALNHGSSGGSRPWPRLNLHLRV
ncbi:hypothetical protein AZE42_11492 [Rhizopogon vesiculosus]|uniref:Uncharacterized protein n=1 Tax=Rhizopogon vesiculosus TaxID=180088 RepID=A0A1J8PYF4_9AGAM|nr:hypothetical protein AZE42_11492 [Rhizopogon vesiculosus]